MTDFNLHDIRFGDDITADDVTDDLEFLDDWEERYRYIIDLGKQLPAMPEVLRTEERFVRGCQSQVWLVTDYSDEDGRLYLAVDSDALIVRGLAAIVLTALNRKTPAEVASCDMEGFFERLDLIRHLSPTRGNGLRSMVARIKHEAERLA